MKFQTLLGLYFIWKNRTLRFPKLDILVFVTLASGLQFFSISSLLPFNTFLGLKTSLFFKSLSLVPILFMFQNC
jgi:hypothetical protein